MGCSASLEKMKLQPGCSPDSRQNLELCERQRKIIQSTWTLLEPKKNDLGIQIFLRLFEANPSLQQIFPEFSDVTLEFLSTDKSLQGHTKRVMKVIENAVTALDDAQGMNEYLTELGRRHRYRQVKPKPNHFQEISKSMISTFGTFLGQEWTLEVSESWRIFLDKIMSLITDGLTSLDSS